MLFTEKERNEIWNRLKTGKSSPMDRVLAHTMKVKGANLKSIQEHAEEIYRTTFISYRLVCRGLIRKSPQFSRIARQLIAINNSKEQPNQ